jgi:hypothetical protein
MKVLEGFGFDQSSDSFAVEPGFRVAFSIDRFADGLNPRNAEDGVEALEDVFAGQSGKGANGRGGVGKASVFAGDRLSLPLVLQFGRLGLPKALLFGGRSNAKPRPPMRADWVTVNPHFKCDAHGKN